MRSPPSSPEVVLTLSRDGRIVFAGRALRTFSCGYLSVVLALFLSERGLSAAQIGAVFTATLVEDAVLTTLLAAVADRVGRRRILILTAPFIAVAGVFLAVARDPLVLMAAAVLGTLSPSGQEAGPFSPIEQAMLADAVPAAERTRAYAWYNIFGFLPAALGALAAGGWLHAVGAWGGTPMEAYRGLLWLYAGGGVILMLLYARLSPDRRSTSAPTPLGLHRSRAVVLQLAALQSVDALAGGFIVQALLAYWFHLRFGVGPEVLGPLFFGTNLLSALSFLVAAPVAERIGLLNTMVLTHLPSNVLLLLVPFMPSFPLAAAALLARHLLSQMDVPTRQAYAMALVAPDERSAAAGFTTSARALAQSAAPVFSGFALAKAASGLPFFLAGGLKIVYDLALYFRFRGVTLAEPPRPR
jgi:MFS family permease